MLKAPSFGKLSSDRKPVTSFILLYLSITLIIIITCFYYYDSEKESLLEDSFQDLKLIADDKTEHLSQWLQNKIVISSLIQNSNSIEIGWKEDFSNLKNLLGVWKWIDSLKNDLSIDNIVLVGKDGKVIYNSKRASNNSSPFDTTLLKRAIRTKEIIFSDHLERRSTRTDIEFYIPIFSRIRVGDRHLLFIMVLNIDNFRVIENLLNQNGYKSKTMETLVFRPAGDSIVYLNSSRFARRGTKIKFPIGNKDLVTVKAIAGNRGIVEGLDYKKEEVVAIIKQIPSSSWFLVTKINKSELYRPISSFAWTVFLISVSSDLLLALILIFVWRKIILTNYRKLYQAEIDKLKLEHKYETMINKVKDYAIFLLGINGDILSWNQGAEQLFGYLSDEILGKNYSILFPENDSLENKPANLLKLVSEKDGCEDEGWRQKKGGKLFWANILISALKDSMNNVEGYIHISRDLTERKNMENILINSESELRKLTAQIQFAREAERQNIAREVHDHLGQLFTGINLNVSYLIDTLEKSKKLSIEKLLNELVTIKSYIDQGVEKVRDISGKLRSFVLDHIGLISALQEYCREIERISDLKCKLKCDISSIDLGDDRNLALFRIIQEAVTNVIRHANATRIDIEIRKEEINFKVIIADNGQGIQHKSERHYSIGIIGMKERTLYLNGTLKIESSVGTGTAVHLTIPSIVKQ